MTPKLITDETKAFLPITITGEDVVGWDDHDHTGALAELGYPYRYVTQVEQNDAWRRTFEVSLGFILRHGLLDQRISDSHYRYSIEYRGYYMEGWDAFVAGKKESNPYHAPRNVEPIHLKSSIHHCVYPWYEGYRDAQAQWNEEQYDISGMQEAIRRIVKEYGLSIKYCDEYGSPYAVTEKGYHVNLA